MKLKVDFKNCYGISELNHMFDFSESNMFAIYASNGSMKTSFAKIFYNTQIGTSKSLADIKDHIFDEQPVLKNIQIDDSDINKKEIFVIRSFDSFYESKTMANLLIDDSQKDKLKVLLKSRDAFYKKLSILSGLKLVKTVSKKKCFELEDVLLKDFEITSVMKNLGTLDTSKNSKELDGVQYNTIFEDSILSTIKSEVFQNHISSFLKKSDEVYNKFTFLKKGTLSFSKIKNVSSSLTENDFFSSDNKLQLSGENEVSSIDALEEQIEKVENLLKETDAFREIEEFLSDSKVESLKNLLEKSPSIINKLKFENIEEFRMDLWSHYMYQLESEYKDLLISYNDFSQENQTEFEMTPWQRAYQIFKDRFTVPFEMEISNKESAVLGESLPKVNFKFCNEDRCVSLERKKIEEEILSQGEKRALYLLHIIFDIEERRRLNNKTVFIVDDIADSFDYKNKYAIVEYLKEITSESNFYLIILSHNFDFYRTVSSRLNIKYNHKLHVKIQSNGLRLFKEEYQNSPFKTWKSKMKGDYKYIIALIPFVRNLIEYGVYNAIYFNKLTSLLHRKTDSDLILFQDLKPIFKAYIGIEDFTANICELSVVTKIYETAERVLDIENNLENKVILAIAIRLKAENFMIDKINDEGFVNSITKFQTIKLFNRYKEHHREKLDILTKVNIMTPENIHLNSFMYEPLLDMDILELKSLFDSFHNS
ncbi:MAG: hypothetical protein KC646_10345 [Candidatus Cloacimonetes bacterium]|nr:hypothetical protein [Candidatus Cloacimonadota bacterium]